MLDKNTIIEMTLVLLKEIPHYSEEELKIKAQIETRLYSLMENKEREEETK